MIDENINKKIIDEEFYRLFLLAENYFATTCVGGFEYHQCLSLKTEQGEQIYSFTGNTVKELIEQSCNMLEREKITVVEKIVCMWEGGAIDVPAHNFLKILYSLNDKNKETQILLRGAENTYHIKKISNIIN